MLYQSGVSELMTTGGDPPTTLTGVTYGITNTSIAAAFPRPGSGNPTHAAVDIVDGANAIIGGTGKVAVGAENSTVWQDSGYVLHATLVGLTPGTTYLIRVRYWDES